MSLCSGRDLLPLKFSRMSPLSAAAQNTAHRWTAHWASSVWTRVWVDLLLRQCNTDTHTHSLMTADNYARSAITAAGIRLAQKLIICLDGRGRYASSNLGHKWKENTDCFHLPRDSSSMLCESESGIVQRGSSETVWPTAVWEHW